MKFIPSMNNWDVSTAFYQSFVPLLHYAVCIGVSWFRKNRHSKRGEAAHRWAQRASGGSIIVRRLICLLYTVGGLLSGIPFYGIPTLYIEPAYDGGGNPLANATHVVTSRRPLSRRNPGAPLSRDDFGWWEMSTESIMGSSNRVPLDTQRPGPLFNRVWSPPPSHWLASRRVNVLFLRPTGTMYILRLDDISNKALRNEYTTCTRNWCIPEVSRAHYSSE